LDKTIVTALMVIVSVVASVMLFNALYPAIIQSNNAMIVMKTRLDDRLQSDVKIIHASGELDGNGAWQDVNGDGRFNTYFWVKNTGASRISPLERLDIFFGPEGNFSRIPHQNNAGGTFPYWTATLENDTEWNPTATLEITIHYNSTLSTGRYFIRIVTPNGTEDSFMMGL
jgi:archaellum component FlaG (FlaF/FlaG flagellin family)